MIFPDPLRMIAPIHEAGHFMVAKALGIKLASVNVTPGSGHGGLCVPAPGQALPTPQHLVYLLAGATAAAMRFPEFRDLAIAGGYADFQKADKLVAERYVEQDRPRIRQWAHDATHRVVSELWSEICALAEELYRNGEVVIPQKVA